MALILSREFPWFPGRDLERTRSRYVARWLPGQKAMGREYDLSRKRGRWIAIISSGKVGSKRDRYLPKGPEGDQTRKRVRDHAKQRPDQEAISHGRDNPIW
jgi:hypothetical protein